MKKPSVCFIAAAIGIALGTGTIAQSMSKEEYAARKERINVEYQSSKSGCDSHSGSDRDICMAEAMGKAKVAKAELESRYNPGPKTLYKVRIARSNATYSVAWQKCNKLAGTLKNVCIQEARSAETTALATAKAEMETSRANAIAAEKSAKAHSKAKAHPYGERAEAEKEAAVARVEANKVAAEAHKNAETSRREALYAVEKEKCEAVAGDVKDRCLADAKARYGES